jgi:glycosyltransferase involved in cell wall biosynthesis
MLTVIIPILNAMPYLTEALASLEAQSFRDFEVCLWDNGSTDGSVEEARRWIPGRFKGRVVADRSLPFHECLAAMVDEAKTEFVARMDGDDICFPERFELQVQALLAESTMGIVGGQCPMMDAAGKPTGDSHPGPLGHEDIVSEMIFRSALTHPALLFRREAILQAGNYAIPKPVEDLDLYLRMARFCRFRNLPDPVLRYRVHPKSICQSDREGQQKQMVDVVARYSAINYGIPAEVYRRLRAKRCRLSITHFLRSASHRARGNPRRFFRIVSSPSFIFVARCMAAPTDILSKAGYRVLDKASGLFMEKAGQ